MIAIIVRAKALPIRYAIIPKINKKKHYIM